MARPWEDHDRYLEALGNAVTTRDKTLATIVLGDFNQRLDGGLSQTPVTLRAKLRDALNDLYVVTGSLAPDKGYLLDHIAVERLTARRVGLVPRIRGDVRRSDHHGSWVET